MKKTEEDVNMPDNEKPQKKSSEKVPKTFRIDEETANKLRNLCADFPNQDTAFNAMMASYEREMLVAAQPKFLEDVRQFEQYQQCLSAKFTDVIKALNTADERAQISVQQLLDSKDTIIQDLQQQLEDAKRSKETCSSLYSSTLKEKEELQGQVEQEQLAVQGLRAEMKEKEAQWSASLQDKIQLNEILTRSVAEKDKELDKQAKYPEMIAERDAQIKEISEQLRILTDKEKDTEYAHRLELLEKDKQVEAVRTDLMQAQEEKISKIREKYEAELEKLREKNEAAQERIQELIAGR